MPSDKITTALIKASQGAKDLTTVKIDYTTNAEQITKAVVYTLAGAIAFNGVAIIVRGLLAKK